MRTFCSSCRGPAAQWRPVPALPSLVPGTPWTRLGKPDSGYQGIYQRSSVRDTAGLWGLLCWLFEKKCRIMSYTAQHDMSKIFLLMCQSFSIVVALFYTTTVFIRCLYCYCNMTNSRTDILLPLSLSTFTNKYNTTSANIYVSL